MRDNFIEFVFKKVVEIAASLGILAALMFFLLKALPGGPFDEEATLHPAVVANLEQHWGLKESTSQQFFKYITGLLQGDLGVSMSKPDRAVTEVIGQGLANTLHLNLMALVLIFISAFGLALLAARFKGRWIEGAIEQSMVALISLPSLFLGPLLIYLFGFYFDLLPVAFLTTPAHYILPVLTLSLRPIAYLVRILKSSLDENLHADFARTAKAKGLSPTAILLKHILRNSLVPVISYSGPLIVSLVSGSFLVEMLFAIPGLGSEFIQSLNERDITMITGLTLFYGALLILISQLMDVVLKAVDPRLRENP
ncbi:Dipeptide transport system permease protein DppB [compost metagenome]